MLQTKTLKFLALQIRTSKFFNVINEDIKFKYCKKNPMLYKLEHYYLKIKFLVCKLFLLQIKHKILLLQLEHQNFSVTN